MVGPYGACRHFGARRQEFPQTFFVIQGNEQRRCQIYHQ